LATFAGYDWLVLEGDTLLVVLAINFPFLSSFWSFANCIYNISLIFASFQSWKALKVFRCANFREHVLAKWAATNLMFGIIPIGFLILSSIKIMNEKILPYSSFLPLN
jgi:hypothetical protein